MSNITQQEATAGAISSVAGKLAVLGGSGTALYGTLTSEFLFAAIGAICAIGTFIVTAYYKRKAHALEKRRVEFQMEMARQAEERKKLVAQASIAAMQSGHSIIAPLRESAAGKL